MIIYIDNENKCHVANDGTMTETLAPSVFVGKCPAFIEGYVFIPRATEEINGEIYGNGLLYPWKDYSELDAAQRQYERELIADMQQALNTLGVTLDE